MGGRVGGCAGNLALWCHNLTLRVTVSDLFHMVLDLFQDPAARILPIGTIISPSGTITLPARMLRFGVKIESRKSESESNVDSRVLGL